MKNLKRLASLLLVLLLTFSMPTACSAAEEENPRIRLSWDGKEVVVRMLDNDAANDFLSKLPLTVSFGDYRERQKTAEVPLDVGTAPGECECLVGDMNYYAPWNDINFFYEDFGYADDLTPLGKVESGIEYLRELDNGSEVRIELAETASAPTAAPPAEVPSRQDSGYTDVAADAWYAEAVRYVRDNGLMSGTSAAEFSPNEITSRAMLVAVLYRHAGSPSVSASANFSDVPADAWCSNAVAWAAANNIASGYGNGQFGANSPVTREQLATILWRYVGSPETTDAAAPFADASSISSFATSAVAWARNEGIVSGKAGNTFDPQGRATRAEMAVMLHRWLNGNETGGSTNTPNLPETPDTSSESRTLVAYFSRTGTTQGMAEMIAERTNGDLFEIIPETAYSEVYQETVSRHQEERRTDARPAITSQVEDMDGYTTIFLGFPLWSADAPMIIRTFMESYDLSGKTVVPFATSGGSGMSAAQSSVETFCPDSNVLNGLCISGGSMESRVSSWLEGLDLPQ
jgi:flavodoxin